MWYIFPFILTTSTFNRLKVQLNQLWPTSFRQPHYLIVPPACGMCGRARRSDPAGGCFRRVWLLPGGSGTHNVPARERPLRGGPECRPLVAVNELLQTDADKAEKCLVKFCLYLPPPPPPPPPGKPLHMEPFTGPAVNRSPCRKKKRKNRKKGEACAHSSVELTGCEWQLVWKANREILLGLVAELFIQKQSFEERRHSSPKHTWGHVLEH